MYHIWYNTQDHTRIHTLHKNTKTFSIFHISGDIMNDNVRRSKGVEPSFGKQEAFYKKKYALPK